MPFPIPEAGLVICYSYLWHSEHERGREEGIKDRPCVVVLKARNVEGKTIVTVAPVTHAPPETQADAVEIPVATKQRLRLDSARSWVVVSEINRFVWPGSDLRPTSRTETAGFDYGFLPPSLFRKIKAGVAACAKAQRLKAVQRTE